MEKAKSIAFRFLKAFVAGSVSTLGTITYFAGVTTWTQLAVALNALLLALVIGGISGVLMAAEKWYSWETVVQ